MATTVLSGAMVLDPDTGSIDRADVLVRDGRIAAVGTDLECRDRVDCRGSLLIPGLIDCHAHVAAPGPAPLPRSARILEAVSTLRRLLARGVTTVRDAWGADAGFSHALREGWISGPDLLTSLRQLSPTGGLGDTWSPDAGCTDSLGDPALPDPVFDGPDAARAAVRRMVRAGADWIKLGASGSLHAVHAGRDVSPTEAELAAVVEEAGRCGRDVMAHAHTARSVADAANAGVRSIEHGVYLDEAAVAAMREQGCWYVPTLSPVSHLGGEEPAAAHRRSLALAVDAGIPVAAGSDLAHRPHVDLLTELRLLSEAGLGDVGAIRSATTEAARLLRLDHDRGRVEPGLRADLVLLEGPTPELANVDHRIRAVWQNGQRVEV
ncbi:imidazolonepropionase-like amidohydrolase [Prauserella shujinwangii]|uniref:Imidazolonepropionase-like amidohydrolase n=1 Tax=Prauserella shujinwangii TaxID=1453103 RepID=A0A2T0LUP8_9PSEU|nr:amidohydrolase family protein [Prauserella shujinwangii]PRX47571.1 imidazolonepropionase-like amidohydrolase [Prauserella shujinwangii]